MSRIPGLRVLAILPCLLMALAPLSFHIAVQAAFQVAPPGPVYLPRAFAGEEQLALSPPEHLASIVDVAAGREHTCALTAAGGVKCWGQNQHGQLGDGTATAHRAPVDVAGLLTGVQAVAAGSNHTCVLTTVGGVKCWGAGWYGQLGDGAAESRVAPVAVSGLTSGVVALAAGGEHTCALTAAGGVKCWGQNGHGQLGDGTTTMRSTPVDVAGLGSGVASLSAGLGHTCAVTTGGDAKCWGWNAAGQVGNGATTDSGSPVMVSGLTGSVQAITAGGRHTCALTLSGAKCWGQNDYGQLGDTTTTARLTPVGVNGLGSSVQALRAGGSHTCALEEGGAKCWGKNDFGQIGNGTVATQVAPAAVSGLNSGVQALATGDRHSCAVTAGGVVCWGYGLGGERGDGSLDGGHMTPIGVSGLASGVKALAAGGDHTCALTTSGGLLCWGKNDFGQLGDGTTIDRVAPAVVSGLSSDVQAVVARAATTCALTTAGGVKCWGANTGGQLGDGTTVHRVTPVDVSGLGAGVQAIAAGGAHTCALTTGGGVKCWGDNSFAQLGDGTTDTRLTPVAVSGLAAGVQGIAAGDAHTCALTTAGGAKCWGKNSAGQLGDGTQLTRSTPEDVTGFAAGVQALAAGNEYSCAVTTSNGLKCWGNNVDGAVGAGPLAYVLTPLDVGTLTGGVQGVAAGSHTCAMTTGGLMCWGFNWFGQIGDGTMHNERHWPTPVNGMAADVQAVAPGSSHTCALAAGGGVLCWGGNYAGQLGISYGLTPATVLAREPPPTPPSGDLPTIQQMTVNAGALASTSPVVTVRLEAQATVGYVVGASLSNDGADWSPWQSYAQDTSWVLTGEDGLKTVYARVRDDLGNVSQTVSQTITLDTAAGTDYAVSIDSGALFANQADVELVIGALPGTTRMMVSNDGGFGGAMWEPFATRRQWQITQYGSYIIPRTVYVRYGDGSGSVLATVSDDIILDVTPPTGRVTVTQSIPITYTGSAVLSLSAADDVSGVAAMRVSSKPTFEGASWQPYQATLGWRFAGDSIVYVQFRDGAGNISPTYSATDPSAWPYHQYLPHVRH